MTKGQVIDDELERFCADAYPKLVAALAHQFGDPWLAEELAQEALIKACDRWGRVRELSSPIGWTFRVGANLGTSWFRRRGAERRARQRHGPGEAVHHDPQVADREVVREALDGLTQQQRQAVVLVHFLGCSAEEAAQATGSTPGAVRGLTHRALRALREVLDVHTEPEATDVP